MAHGRSLYGRSGHRLAWVGVTLAAHLRQQGEACAALGSPMYAALCARLADDLVAGGPTAALLEPHVGLRGPDALALRLLGSVHRLVLERRAGALATYYPSVGGTWREETGWAAFRRLLADQPDEVASWLDRAPQTNEVGRAAALVGALLHLPGRFRLPVRLHELGASAGLLLRADRLAYVGSDGRTQGPADAPLTLDPAWTPHPGEPWPDLTFVERHGCDAHPVDPTTPEGRTVLSAYTWPDQPARWERLRAALDLARTVPAEVVAESAGAYAARLAPRTGTLTVVWHSVFRQYLPPGEQERLDAALRALLDRARPEAPVAHVALEPRRPAPGAPHAFLVTLAASDGDEVAERVLGTAEAHGPPCRWATTHADTR